MEDKCTSFTQQKHIPWYKY